MILITRGTIAGRKELGGKCRVMRESIMDILQRGNEEEAMDTT